MVILFETECFLDLYADDTLRFQQMSLLYVNSMVAQVISEHNMYLFAFPSKNNVIQALLYKNKNMCQPYNKYLVTSEQGLVKPT